MYPTVTMETFANSNIHVSPTGCFCVTFLSFTDQMLSVFPPSYTITSRIIKIGFVFQNSSSSHLGVNKEVVELVEQPQPAQHKTTVTVHISLKTPVINVVIFLSSPLRAGLMTAF